VGRAYLDVEDPLKIYFVGKAFLQLALNDAAPTTESLGTINGSFIHYEISAKGLGTDTIFL
jgi:hypothetical protein